MEGPSGDPMRTLTVNVNDEGFYSQSYITQPDRRLKKLLNDYRRRLCASCTDPSLLVFWYEATQLEDTHTAEALGLTDGDIIDVRVPSQHTRGACPVPPQQTLPNIHYVVKSEAGSADEGGEGVTPLALVHAQQNGPTDAPLGVPARQRLNLKIRDQAGAAMEVTMKMDSRFEKVMENFAAMVGKHVMFCIFLHDETRLLKTHTPRELEMEDGDIIEVHSEQRGGGWRF